MLFVMKGFVRRVIAGMLITVFLVAGGIQEIIALGEERSYAVRQGQLKLRVPEGWSEEAPSPKIATAFSLNFRPEQGARFLIRSTVSWDDKAGVKFNSDGRLQEIAMAAGNQFLPRSVETRLKLQEVKGEFLRGYYFVLTDKAPRAGDYQIMAQGAAALGEVLILFTYLGYPGGETELQRLLEMLQRASLTSSISQR